MKLLRRKKDAAKHLEQTESELESIQTLKQLGGILSRLEGSIQELTSTTEMLTFTVVASGAEVANEETFRRFGGVYGVRQAVTLLYSRVMDDPELAPYFRGADMVRIIYRQADMFLAILGIQSYTGLRLGVAHRHLNIHPRTFEKLMGHVRAVLIEVGLSPEEVEEFIDRLEDFKPEIVSGGQPTWQTK